MFDLDKALADWRETTSENDSFDCDSLMELENHLRDEVDALMSQGLPAKEAYEVACKQLGQQATLNTEYAKVHPDVSWRRRLLAMIVGYMSVSALLGVAWIVPFLFERWLWRLGCDKVVHSLPWSVHVDGGPSALMSGGASRELLQWNEVSLATLLTAGVRAVVIGMLVYFAYRCLHGRVNWLDKLLTRCRSTRDRLLVSLVLLGVLFYLLSCDSSWAFRLDELLGNGAEYSKFVYEMQSNGEALISPFTMWIRPLAYCLTAWFALQAYRKQQLSGSYEVVPTAVCGFLSACLLARMASFLNSLIMVNLELSETEINYGSSLAPIIYTLSLSVVVGAFVVAMSGRGFPTLRRFLGSLPRRPYLVMIVWIIMHWASLPLQFAMGFMGLSHDNPLLENEVLQPVWRLLWTHWVPIEPFMHFPLSGFIFSAVLTLVVVFLAVRSKPRTTASSRPETLA